MPISSLLIRFAATIVRGIGEPAAATESGCA
jgi:hypothetical protein